MWTFIQGHIECPAGGTEMHCTHIHAENWNPPRIRRSTTFHHTTRRSHFNPFDKQQEQRERERERCFVARNEYGFLNGITRLILFSTPQQQEQQQYSVCDCSQMVS